MLERRSDGSQANRVVVTPAATGPMVLTTRGARRNRQGHLMRCRSRWLRAEANRCARRGTNAGMPCLADSVAVAQQVRAPGCGPGGRGFKSPRSPQFRPVQSLLELSSDGRSPYGNRPRSADDRTVDSLRASSSTAEQRTLNPQVSGSNPEGRTPTPLLSRACGDVNSEPS
jgi:hypothetical protein